MVAYAWPGNGRELRNVIERVSCLAAAGELGRRALVDIAPELVPGFAIGGGEREAPLLRARSSGGRSGGA
ncbi:hypothetical protein [Sorangium atrum]|uniref:hypothetical protein n=1 Tax=Sorangium atrum TaxID=2995308 RepID=UPI004033089D